MGKNPWPTKAQIEEMKARQAGTGKPQSGSLRLESEVDLSKGLSSVFPQSQELEELRQRLERKYRRSSETHIDPETGEIREYASNPATGEAEWTHYGAMPPPKAPAEQPESGPPPAGSVNWDEIDRQTRAKYGLPAKQPLGDVPSGGSSTERPTSPGTPYLPGMEPEPEAAPKSPAPPPEPAPEPSPANPTPVPGAANAGAAHAFRDLGSAVGYAFGSLGGPLGSSIGMAAGGMLGTVLGGGELKPRDVAKTTLGLAGGAIAGTIGSKIGSALGGLFAVGTEEGGGGGGGGGSTTVSGGGLEGDGGEMVRLLREISINIRTLLNDGLYVRGDHRRAGGSTI